MSAPSISGWDVQRHREALEQQIADLRAKAAALSEAEDTRVEKRGPALDALVDAIPQGRPTTDVEAMKSNVAIVASEEADVEEELHAWRASAEIFGVRAAAADAELRLAHLNELTEQGDLAAGNPEWSAYCSLVLQDLAAEVDHAVARVKQCTRRLDAIRAVRAAMEKELRNLSRAGRTPQPVYEAGTEPAQDPAAPAPRVTAGRRGRPSRRDSDGGPPAGPDTSGPPAGPRGSVLLTV